MELTRREWMLAVGAMPLQLAALTELTAQGRPGSASDKPLVPLGPPPTLPDKASFPNLRGTYLNGAAVHPMSAGSTDLVRKAMTGIDEADGFRPNQTRIRETFAKLINAVPEEIVFVPSTSIGEAFIASAVGLHEKGAHVVSDHLHFIGSQMMYTEMTKRGLQVTWVKARDNRIPLDELDRAIVKGQTRLVAVSSTSFVNGFQHDLKRVCEIAHAKGALVHVDGIQSIGNSPVDVKECGVDSMSAATYKWLMAPGTAFLYVRKESQARMQAPYYHHSQYTDLPTTHMYMYDTPSDVIVDNYTPRDGAAGMFSMAYTPSLVSLAALEYSLPYIMNIGVGAIQAHAQTLVSRLKEELPKRGYPLLTPVDARSPIVTVAAKDAERLAPAFNAANVRVTTRWNHIRIATSVFNDMDDVEKLLRALPSPT